MIFDIWFAVDIAAQWNHLRWTWWKVFQIDVLSPRLSTKREHFHSGQNLRSSIPIFLKTSFVWINGPKLYWNHYSLDICDKKRIKDILENHYYYQILFFCKIIQPCKVLSELSPFVPESGDASFHIRILSHIVAHLNLFLETNKSAYMWGRETLSVNIGVYISCMGLFLHAA